MNKVKKKKLKIAVIQELIFFFFFFEYVVEFSWMPFCQISM